MEENKKTIWRSVKQFFTEIIAGIVFVIVAFLFLFDENFSKTIITRFIRPSTALTFLVVLGCLTAFLVFLYLIQARKKKLKSTSRMSAFDKTVVCDHKVRAMSVTQAFYEPSDAIISLKNQMADVNSHNPNIVEIYFNNEVDLNI